MKNLSSLSKNEIVDILSNRTTTEIIVDRVVLGFENIEEVLNGRNLAGYFILTPQIPFEVSIDTIYTHSTNDSKGLWRKIEMLVYKLRGLVYYKANDRNTFLVKIDFTTIEHINEELTN